MRKGKLTKPSVELLKASDKLAEQENLLQLGKSYEELKKHRRLLDSYNQA